LNNEVMNMKYKILQSEVSVTYINDEYYSSKYTSEETATLFDPDEYVNTLFSDDQILFKANDFHGSGNTVYQIFTKTSCMCRLETFTTLVFIPILK
jgi:hypothetical protein